MPPILTASSSSTRRTVAEPERSIGASGWVLAVRADPSIVAAVPPDPSPEAASAGCALATWRGRNIWNVVPLPTSESQ